MGFLGVRATEFAVLYCNQLAVYIALCSNIVRRCVLPLSQKIADGLGLYICQLSLKSEKIGLFLALLDVLPDDQVPFNYRLRQGFDLLGLRCDS